MPSLWIMPGELESPESPYAFEACKAASYVLWAFSGRKYHGLRTVTEVYECPCRSSSFSSFRISPYLDGSGLIRNEIITDRIGGCGCSGLVAGRHTRLRLRGAPVRNVASVKVGGEEILPPDYKIVNGNLLQLTGGSNDVCGLEITYTYGINVPKAGKLAAKKLADELTRGWAGDEDCALPDRVTNVTRMGVSFTVMDPQDFLDDGRTGLYEVDLFLRAANPDKARKPAKVFSPDLPKAYRVTQGPVPRNMTPLDWTYVPGSTASWGVALTDYDGDVLFGGAYEPNGTVSSFDGTTLVELGPERFTIENGRISAQLTGIETTALGGRIGLFDLYGLHAVDGTTLVHVFTSHLYPE